MLLFKPEHIDPILGKTKWLKTATRRIGNRKYNVGVTHQCKTSFYVTAFASIRILRVYEQRLGDMTEEDAHREGYDSVKTYRKAFNRVFRAHTWEPEPWDDDRVVKVIEFERVKP